MPCSRGESSVLSVVYTLSKAWHVHARGTHDEAGRDDVENRRVELDRDDYA